MIRPKSIGEAMRIIQQLEETKTALTKQAMEQQIEITELQEIADAKVTVYETGREAKITELQAVVDRLADSKRMIKLRKREVWEIFLNREAAARLKCAREHATPEVENVATT